MKTSASNLAVMNVEGKLSMFFSFCCFYCNLLILYLHFFGVSIPQYAFVHKPPRHITATSTTHVDFSTHKPLRPRHNINNLCSRCRLGHTSVPPYTNCLHRSNIDNARQFDVKYVNFSFFSFSFLFFSII
jgi:hypothetical protein